MTTTMPETSESTTTLEEMFPYRNDGGKHMTHIVNSEMNSHIWEDGMTSKDVVALARITGQEVVALCGYRWIPERDPKKYPVCQTCMDIATGIVNE